MDASKFWMRQVLLFGFPFLDSMKTYGTLPKNYDSLELIRNIFAIIFSYFYYVHILYVYAYIHVYISCLIVHVLLSKSFKIFGFFFIRNSFYS